MALISRKTLIDRLRRSNVARKQLVESHLAKTIAYQIRATRDRLGWSQERFAQEVGMNQNAISRLESPNYGKPTLTTLKRVAAALDVALIVRLVPFSEFVDWISGTLHTVPGLSTEALAVPAFDVEEADGAFLLANAAAAATQTSQAINQLHPTNAATANVLSGGNNAIAQRASGEIDLAVRYSVSQPQWLGSFAGGYGAKRSLQISAIPQAGRSSASYQSQQFGV
jgi:transcriptional regulator with XRE-family HTH domain